MILTVISLIALGSLATAVEVPCVTCCYSSVTPSLIESGFYYLDVSEKYMRKWKADCQRCPVRADAFRRLADEYLSVLYDDGPYFVLDNPLKKSFPAPLKAAEDCTFANLTSMYGWMRSNLTLAQTQFKAIQEACAGDVCDALATSYDEYLQKFYDTLNTLYYAISGCADECDEVVSIRVPSDPCDPPCKPYEVQKWLLDIGTRHGLRAIERWNSLPTVGDCCWEQISMLNRAYGDVQLSADVAAYVLDEATNSTTVYPTDYPVKFSPGRKSCLPGCKQGVSYELITAALPTLTTANTFLKAFIDNLAACPNFADGEQAQEAKNQTVALITASYQILKQMDYYYEPILEGCPSQYQTN